MLKTYGEREGAVNYHFLASRLAECLSPLQLSGIPLHLELFVVNILSCAERSSGSGIGRHENGEIAYILVTFRPAESEGFGIVSHECDTFLKTSMSAFSFSRFGTPKQLK